MSHIACSLVIPCYNEAANLPALIERIAAVFAGKHGYEVILVDNGSIDATPRILAEAVKHRTPLLRTVRVPVNQGYGWGILQGLAAAEGDFLGWTHADMQTDPADALTGFAMLSQGAAAPDFVKGHRHGRRLADELFTVGMSLFDSMLFGLPLWDINAQPTLFSREFYRSWSNPPHDFALDLYAYATAARARCRIGRFPVHFGPRLHGTSHWNVSLRDKWKFIRRTMQFSLALRRSWKAQ